ncbi:MAG: hypothetical protein IKU45_03870 [Clostridia bacterium]|nr:hypothetical protein [Clostridia bacterium]
MKSVLISINPKWVAKIASGEKKVEVRKKYPHCELPFKCYIYCTSVKNIPLSEYVELHRTTGGEIDVWNGKVCGEFVCFGIDEFVPTENGIMIGRFASLHDTCLKVSEMRDYLKGKKGYGWRISNLKIYEVPKDITDFSYYKKCNRCNGKERGDHKACDFYNEKCEYLVSLERPPQSWQFVEGKNDD